MCRRAALRPSLRHANTCWQVTLTSASTVTEASTVLECDCSGGAHRGARPRLSSGSWWMPWTSLQIKWVGNQVQSDRSPQCAAALASSSWGMASSRSLMCFMAGSISTVERHVAPPAVLPDAAGPAGKSNPQLMPAHAHVLDCGSTSTVERNAAAPPAVLPEFADPVERWRPCDVNS